MKKLLIIFIVILLAGCSAGVAVQEDVDNAISNHIDEQNVPEVIDESPDSTAQPQEATQPSIELAANTKYECELNIPFDFSKHPDRTYFPLNDAEGFDEMISEIKKVDPSFDGEGYYVFINKVSRNENSGFIKFTYYIGNEIKTSKVYFLSVRTGTITKLSFTNRPFPENREEHERALIEKVNDFKEAYEPEEVDMTDVVEIEEKYYYEYETGELRYSHTVWREVGEEGFEVMVDDYTEIIIE